MGTVAMSGNTPQDNRSEEDIIKPMAVVGVEGIYDLRGLRDKYCEYAGFIEATFGTTEEVWDWVSPMRTREGGVEQGWKEGRLAVLAHSRGDELVDLSQTKAMAEALDHWRRGDPAGMRRVLLLEDLDESHDDVWKKGEELAHVISTAIAELKGMERDYRVGI